MSEAHYKDTSRQDGSLADRLANLAPGALKSQANALAHVRRQRIPYGLAALVIGVGVGLMLYRPTRNAAGSFVSKGWNSARGGFGAQLTRELSSLIRR